MKHLLFVLIIILTTIAQELRAQEIMPQGIFLQTCSPVLGEKYIFEGTNFSYYSEELGLYGQGTYVLKRNRISFEFQEAIQLPSYNISYQTATPSLSRELLIRLFSPGDFKNQAGVRIEIICPENETILRTDNPVVDSHLFQGSEIPEAGQIKIFHPTEGEFIVPFYYDDRRTAVLDIWFKNNWEAIPMNTGKRYKIENIRISSFLMEKTLVRKTFFCVFIRQDQAERIMEQKKTK